MTENVDLFTASQELFLRKRAPASGRDRALLSPSVPRSSPQKDDSELSIITLDETQSDGLSSDLENGSTTNKRKRQTRQAPQQPAPRRRKHFYKKLNASDSDSDEGIVVATQVERAIAERFGLTVVPDRKNAKQQSLPKVVEPPVASTSKQAVPSTVAPPPRKKVIRSSLTSSAKDDQPKERERDDSKSRSGSPKPVVDFWAIDNVPVQKAKGKEVHKHGQATRELARLAEQSAPLELAPDSRPDDAISYGDDDDDDDDAIIPSSLEIDDGPLGRYERVDVVAKRKKAESLAQLKEKRQAKSAAPVASTSKKTSLTQSNLTTGLFSGYKPSQKNCVYCCESFPANEFDEHAATCFENLTKKHADEQQEAQLLAELNFSPPKNQERAGPSKSTNKSNGKTPEIILSDEFVIEDDDFDFDLIEQPVVTRGRNNNTNASTSAKSRNATGKQPSSSPPEGSIYISSLRADLRAGLESLYAAKAGQDEEPIDGLAPQNMTTAGAGAGGRGRGGGKRGASRFVFRGRRGAGGGGGGGGWRGRRRK